MSVLIVNYHRTESTSSNAAGHVIADGEFDEQLNFIRSHQLPVISAAEMCIRSGREHSPRIAFTFDDGAKSDLRNALKLSMLGWSATFFVSTSNISKPGYLDAAEVKELAAMGMSVGSHSHEHRRLTRMPVRDAETNIRQSREILEDLLGAKVDRFAFPGGAYSSAILQLSNLHGFKHHFGTAWGVNRDGQSSEGRVFRRNNIIHGMPIDEYSDIVTLNRYRRRQAKYLLRTAAATLLPERLYGRVRRLATKSG